MKEEEKENHGKHEHHEHHEHHEYEFTIDSKHCKTKEHFILGEHIRKEGNVPTDYKIYLKVKGPGDDKLIENHEKVELHKHHTEHFFSCKPNTNNG